MPAATVRASWYGGSATEPAGVTAETGVALSKSDVQVGTTPTTVPTTTGSNYSWVQQVALEVTGAASPSTTLSNATVKLSGTPTAGTLVFYKANSSFVNQTGGSGGPADVGTESSGSPTTPATYAIVTTSAVQYDAMGSAGNGGTTGRKSIFADLLFGMCSAYSGAPGSLTLPNGILSYDEA
jgi:hypothetical protein